MITKMVTKVGNVCKPKYYKDVFQLSRILKDNGFLLISLEKVSNIKTQKKIIDFLCGVAYAMDGDFYWRRSLGFFSVNQPDHGKIYTAFLEEIATLSAKKSSLTKIPVKGLSKRKERHISTKSA